jgi:hypothetical protein
VPRGASSVFAPSAAPFNALAEAHSCQIFEMLRDSAGAEEWV